MPSFPVFVYRLNEDKNNISTLFGLTLDNLIFILVGKAENIKDVRRKYVLTDIGCRLGIIRNDPEM